MEHPEREVREETVVRKESVRQSRTLSQSHPHTYDANADGLLDGDEPGALKRVNPDALVGLLRFDANRDGIVDSDEMVEIEADSANELQAEVLCDLIEKVESLRLMRQRYTELLWFMVFFVLYLSVLYLQSNATTAFTVQEAVLQAVQPKDTVSGEVLESFNSYADIYQWISTQLVLPLWADPVCGDGHCSLPKEYQGRRPSFDSVNRNGIGDH
jgi:hypothetical protein